MMERGTSVALNFYRWKNKVHPANAYPGLEGVVEK